MDILGESIDDSARSVFVKELHLGVDQAVHDFGVNVSVDAHEDEAAHILAENCDHEADDDDDA